MRQRISGRLPRKFGIVVRKHQQTLDSGGNTHEIMHVRTTERRPNRDASLLMHRNRRLNAFGKPEHISDLASEMHCSAFGSP